MNEFFKSWRFKVLVGVAIVIFAFMLRAAASGGVDIIVSQAVGAVTTPFLKLSSSVSGAAKGFMERYVLTEKVYMENEELKGELRELNEKLVEYETIKRENEQFREFLELKQKNPDFDFETAMIIGRDSTSRFASFTIDKGSLAGIEIADPVITSDGLVGIVWEVGLTYAHIRTVLDTSMEVGVYDIRTRDSGIVTGDIALSADGLCKLRYIPRESGASAGDLVVTSGIGGVFPKDLVVGTLISVAPETSGISLYASVRPAADIQNVTDVLVIKYFEGQGRAAEKESSSTPESSGTGNSSSLGSLESAEGSGTEETAESTGSSGTEAGND